MKLFVDDWRPCPDGWEVARSIGEAIQMIRIFDPEVISLDHDISHTNNGIFQMACTENFGSVAEYICALYQGHQTAKPKIIIHTMNPLGATKLMEIFYGREFDVERNEEYMK